MADTIILYSSAGHLNSMLILANFIAKHHPSISVTIFSTAPDYAAEPSISGVASITYHRLTAIIPPNFTKDPRELFFEIPRLNNPNLRQALEEIALKSNIRAVVMDFLCNSAFEVSTSMEIPTYFYVSSGGFSLCTFVYFPTIDERIVEDIGDYNNFLYAPGCPPVHSLDYPKGMFFRKSNIYKYYLSMAENMRRSNGLLVNSFDALEFRAKEALRNGLCNPDGKTPPVYFVGPLVAGFRNSGKNSELSDLEPRHECLKWLDSQPSKSVIFLCFGRWGWVSEKQLREIAIGLENSGHRFLWSVRSPSDDLKLDPNLDTLLPKGFIERTKDRGYIIKMWAPQKEVLNHDSVGGFVTHCGRSSTLEALSFRVPMIGLPIHAEQRMNRVYMVEEMKISLPLDDEGNEGFVTALEVEKRVRELFDSTNGKAIRMRVEEMKIATKAAVEKGGSSVVALEKFIKNVIG